MDITSRAEFAATPEQVFTMLTDQGYLEQVCVASHALSYECSVQGSTTRSRRELPAPEQARKFTGASLTIVEEVAWGDADPQGARTARLTLSVPGQPMTMTGTASLAPGGAGSVVSVAADLKVNIPLLGKKLEQSAAPAILEGLKIQEDVGKDWLAQH
ncbi:MAG TPA: DUF2505 domain-containing protein [Candidatus Avipropionibacterium avicola]|uniref:DUF2505 domain-containing protein n=1 Tax=Candidatus Avipropionibacterium avicola TaxID=2840701 RepID=A0A9D1GZ07_9ACTN|nr:DUF2505 domain-containing protein [Candidatus Avipropionibacterium avicola]